MFATARTRGSRAIRAIALVTATATALVLAACTSGGGTDATSDTLTVAITTPPQSLDPTSAANGVPLIWYMNLAYEPLIKRGVDGAAAPGLATEWAYSDDRLSFTMKLREGVKFSDGDPLTADAVVAWLKHYKESGSFAAWLANVTDITASGPLEVTLKLSTPDPMLPYGFDQGGNAGAIVSPTGLKDPTVLGTETHGAGPYMLDPAATVANSTYTYVKNPNYWNPEVQYWNTIVLQVFTDSNSVLSALRSGQVQVAQGSATTAGAAADAGFDVTTAPSGMVGIYLADIDGKIVPALKDVRVRQALNYAIDREAITKSIYGEYGIPTTQFVPEGIGGYLPALEDTYPYDPEKAKALLAEAGYPDGFSFTVAGQPGFDGSDLLPQAMAAQFEKIGVHMEVKSYTAFGDYVSELLGGTIPATTLQFNYSVQLTDTQQLVTNPAVYNYLGYTDAKANELVAAQRAQDVDTPEGIAAAEASETYMVENAFLVPVASIQTVLFSAKSVSNIDFTAYPWPDPSRWTPAN
ncbi:MAG: ABC transporter substrate-binding protein [Pseudolysinimonas sp.]|uniref:ABC transporter substrate-binding protein n=1 Tax=Pseudolysinimonas sp. TaxID=2680009 RepID=UPI0032630D9B